MAEQDKFLKIKSVAEMTGISKTTLYQLIKDDPTFPKARKIGPKLIVYSLAEINKWLDGKMEAPTI